MGEPLECSQSHPRNTTGFGLLVTIIAATVEFGGEFHWAKKRIEQRREALGILTPDRVTTAFGAIY